MSQAASGRATPSLRLPGSPPSTQWAQSFVAQVGQYIRRLTGVQPLRGEPGLSLVSGRGWEQHPRLTLDSFLSLHHPNQPLPDA